MDNLKGKKFKKLTVIGFSHVRDSNAYWKCRCECGKTLVVPGHRLKQGQISCGCIKVFKHKKGVSGFNSLIAFKLSLKEFKKLTQGNCFYCGTIPGNLSITRPSIDKKLNDHKIYRYNGIDRVDSSKGYVKGNVVSCCKWCNIAKWNKNQKEFKEHIFKIYNNLF
jgi:hypothetical protein